MDTKCNLSFIHGWTLIVLVTIISCSGPRQRYYFSTYRPGHPIDSLRMKSDSTPGHVTKVNMRLSDTARSSQPRDTMRVGGTVVEEPTPAVLHEPAKLVKTYPGNLKNQKKQTQESKQKPDAEGLVMVFVSLFLALIFLQSGSLIALGGAVVAYIAGIVLSIRGIRQGNKRAKITFLVLILIAFAVLLIVREMLSGPGFGANPFSGII